MDANGSRAYVPYHVTENSMNIVPNLCHEYITLAEVEVVHHRECEKKKKALHQHLDYDTSPP